MILRILLLLVCFNSAWALAPVGGGELQTPSDESGHSAYTEKALERARINSQKLKTSSGMSLQAVTPNPLLRWPVRKAITVKDPAIEGISNFLDQDPSEGGMLDYGCGDRTYDGHRGLDIYSMPYSWLKMEKDELIVVAAAAGMITEKISHHPERSCDSDASVDENNLIVIEHADGSMAIYAHMRTGSLNAKTIGEVVSVGEYLGVVGSAGNSTGPHLHFEVGSWVQNKDIFTWVPNDPFSGTCNDLNVDTWWENQPEYYTSTLSAIATHSMAPEIPPCPQTETPHYSSAFTAGQTAYFAAYYRDQRQGQVSHYFVYTPNGEVYQHWDHSSPEEHYSSSYWYWNFPLPADLPGEWSFEVVFEDQTVTHSFFVDAIADPSPVMPETNNAYNGAWYDPTLDGEGYNIITTSSGTVVYFYGSDVDGERLWLLSGVIKEVIEEGVSSTFVMYESTGGTHGQPIGSARGLSVWGELEITFSSCSEGTAILNGLDGQKTSEIEKIVGVAGTNCIDLATDDGPLAGAWFDPAFEGEGFNLIVAPVGAVIYYYGFDTQGNRLWFISRLIPETLQVGQPVSNDLFKATDGTFDTPVASDLALERWGSVSIETLDCTHLTITMDTVEGLKVSSTVKIAGVVGLTCIN